MHVPSNFEYLWIKFFRETHPFPTTSPIFQPPPTSMPPSLQITWTPSSMGIENPKVVQGGSLGGSRQCLACFKLKVAHNNDEEGQKKKKNMDYKSKHEKMTNILCVCILYVFACSLTTRHDKILKPFQRQLLDLMAACSINLMRKNTKRRVSKLGTLK